MNKLIKLDDDSDVMTHGNDVNETENTPDVVTHASDERDLGVWV